MQIECIKIKYHCIYVIYCVDSISYIKQITVSFLLIYFSSPPLQFVLGFSIIIHSPVTYGSYTYPDWAIGVGWVYALVSLVPLPLIAGIKVLQAEGPIFKVKIRRQCDIRLMLD